MALLHLLITKTPLKARISGLFSYFQRLLHCIGRFFGCLFSGSTNACLKPFILLIF